MKKTTLLVLVLFSILTGFGQGQYSSGNPKIYNSWKEKTLIVILYPESDSYNEAARSIAEKRWVNDRIVYLNYGDSPKIKANKYVVLDVKSLTQPLYSLSNKPKCDIPCSPSYEIRICLSPKVGQEVFFSWKKGFVSIGIPTNYDFMQYVDWRNHPEYMAPPLEPIKSVAIVEYWMVINLLKQLSTDRIEILIEGLFNSFNQFKEEEFNQYVIPTKAFDPKTDTTIINSVKNKVLLVDRKSIPRSHLDTFLYNIDTLKYLYQGEIRIVTEEELAQFIFNRDTSVLYLEIRNQSYIPHFYIYNLSERRIIYYNMYYNRKDGRLIEENKKARESFFKSPSDFFHCRRYNYDYKGWETPNTIAFRDLLTSLSEEMFGK